ncbi:MAG: ketose-bisphosphate aldolase [bacterium]
MKTLRECIKEAGDKHVAIGHFNISNLEALHGIYNAARALDVPVIIGLSEGEEKFMGRDEAAALIKMYRERDMYPIFLNADHHASFESAKACIDAGFDMVIIDGAKLPMDENITMTKQVVDYAHEITKNTGRDIIVEAELGYIGSGSDIKDSIPEGAGVLTKPEDAKAFVDATGIDMFAPSVGSIHGLIKTGKPHIDAELVKKIKETVGIPLVLHGGSGLRDEDFINAVKAGISVIHINSELRLAYEEAVKKFVNENPEEINPSKILKPAVDAIEAIVSARLRAFQSNRMKEEILKFWKGDADDSEETLRKYSHDASIFDVRPKLVLFPKDADDVKALVKWVSENCARQDLTQKYGKLSITARCAGTDMSGGSINESIILDFSKYMNQLVKFEGENITVQPGMFYRDFEKITLERNLVLPCYTASKNINAMGGMYGNNSAGERTLRYGKTEDYVMEAKVVFADGNLYTVKPLNESELQAKIAQGDFEGNAYKNIYELIQKNKGDIDKAKPNVHKNSAGYYIWNVLHTDSENSSGLTLPGSTGRDPHQSEFSESVFRFE